MKNKIKLGNALFLFINEKIINFKDSIYDFSYDISLFIFIGKLYRNCYLFIFHKLININ